MDRRSEYYNRVANMLCKMKHGETFEIKKHVKPENQELFIECFKAYAGLVNCDRWWFEWDDQLLTITYRESCDYRNRNTIWVRDKEKKIWLQR